MTHSHFQTAPRRAPMFAPLLAATLLLPALTAQSTEDLVSNARTAIEKWTDTRRIISKETQDWAVGKEALSARLDVVKREIVTMQKRIGDARASVAEADKKRNELIVESDRLKATLGSLEDTVKLLEARTRKLLPRLPEPLREKVKPLTQLLPHEGEPSKLQVDVRYGNVVAILNELQKWNREVTAASEVRQMQDGSNVEVTVLYVGLGQAYYTGGNGKVAGTGVATADGWTWKPQNELAPAVQKAIAIFKNEQVASYVRLPVQVQ